jgi:translation elongation factor EF-Ts
LLQQQQQYGRDMFGLPLRRFLLQASPRCVSVVEVNSETDFVGRSEPFQQLVKAAAAAAASLLPQQPPAAVQLQQLGFEQLSSARLDASGATIAEGCASLAGKVRENIAMRRGWIMAGGTNSEYAAAAAAAVSDAVVAVAAAATAAVASACYQEYGESVAHRRCAAPPMHAWHLAAATLCSAVLTAAPTA